MNTSFTGGDLSLFDLVDINVWQNIQDRFALVTDICLRTLSANGQSITSSNKKPRLCYELLNDSVLKRDICGPCLPTFLGGRGVVDKNLSFSCKAGLCMLVSPLKIENKVWGYIVAGPLFLVMRKPKEQYRQIAEEFGLGLENFWSALLEIKVISFQGAHSLIELIKDIGEYTIKQAYCNQLKKKNITIEPEPPKTGKFLEALLDVAFQLSGASIGSIMLLNKDKNELNIQASRGLSDEIVKKSRVKIGEGISGTAVSENRSFLLDNDTAENRLKPYLNRPNISSSMVIPIKVEDKVLGVVNLGAPDTSSIRFNQDNLGTLDKLINLAAIAIQP